MTEARVSVVVVSRARPRALRRCLIALSQLRYPAFEIVVVADHAGCRSARTLAFSGALKLVEFDVPNVAAARNLGIRHAAGDLVAFIDDDAVPEPSWLRYVAEAGARKGVAAVGGFVRGRGGIAFLTKAQWVDAAGRAYPLDVNPARVTLFAPKPGQAVKIEGTNMAVRRDLLVRMGGFDEAYHHGFEDLDLTLRLARGGHIVAIAPQAQVHHALASSLRRRRDGGPRDLFDHGAGWSVFQRKFLEPSARAAHWRHVRQTARDGLIRDMVTGALEPPDVSRLLRRMDVGYLQGTERQLEQGLTAPVGAQKFHKFSAPNKNSVFLYSHKWMARRMRKIAKNLVSEGATVTLLLLTRTARRHSLRFVTDGYWEQVGGVFGPSDEADPPVQVQNLEKRAEKERYRVAPLREFNDYDA